MVRQLVPVIKPKLDARQPSPLHNKLAPVVVSIDVIMKIPADVGQPRRRERLIERGEKY
jgi:hypothetical protein